MSGQPQELMNVLEERLMLEMRHMGGEISAQAAMPQAQRLNQKIESLVEAIGDEDLSTTWAKYLSASSSNSPEAFPHMRSLVNRADTLNQA
ncbi:MAG: hypothetical protein JW722_08115 [Demequinaceae bacterium]|nr:hypothetical protein [Demequinaceae bacterium]